MVLVKVPSLGHQDAPGGDQTPSPEVEEDVAPKADPAAKDAIVLASDVLAASGANNADSATTEAANTAGPKLSWDTVRAVYRYALRPNAMFVSVVLLVLGPWWAVSRALRPGVKYTMKEFKAACDVGDTGLEDSDGLLMLNQYKNLVIALTGFAVPLVSRVEVMVGSCSDEEQKRVRSRRYWWAASTVPPFLILWWNTWLIADLSRKAYVQHDAPMMYYSAQAGILIAFGLNAVGMVRQGLALDRPWFGTAGGAVFAGVVFCVILVSTAFLLIAAVVLLRKFGTQMLIALSLIKAIFVFILKQVCARAGVDAGVYLYFIMIVHVALIATGKVYSLLQASFGEIVYANCLTMAINIAGQVFNFISHKLQHHLTGNHMPRIHQVLHDAQQVHDVSSAFSITVMALLVIMIPDPRYFYVSDLVGVSDSPNYDLVFASFFMACACELVHQAVMFPLVYRSRPNTDLELMVGTSRMKRVYPSIFLVAQLAQCAGLCYIRWPCLRCYADLPTDACKDE